MLALGRALMSEPRILLIDEPSVGLAPILVSRTIDKIKELKEKFELTVLMAEQNFESQAVQIADRGYVIVHGHIAFEGHNTDELNEQRTHAEILPRAVSRTVRISRAQQKPQQISSTMHPGEEGRHPRVSLSCV